MHPLYLFHFIGDFPHTSFCSILICLNTLLCCLLPSTQGYLSLSDSSSNAFHGCGGLKVPTFLHEGALLQTYTPLLIRIFLFSLPSQSPTHPVLGQFRITCFSSILNALLLLLLLPLLPRNPQYSWPCNGRACCWRTGSPSGT